MSSPQPGLENRAGKQALAARAAFYCAWGSAAANLVSIAVSQILLGLSFALLLVSRRKLRVPPIWIPLSVFVFGTVVSLLASGDPAAGLPQIKKFYVYLTLVAVFSTFRRAEEARNLVLTWSAVGGVSAAIGLVQFARKVQEAHRAGLNFYDYYVAERITGFMSHWMTFGGEQMIVLLMLGAFVCFSPRARRRALWLALAGLALLAAALMLGYTRGIWIGTAFAAVYLIWFRRRRLLLFIPLAIAAVLWLNPGGVRARFESGFRPNGYIDSNEHRIVCWRTGWEMIRAHPWLGLGPEIVRLKFDEYVPRDIPRPLPPGWYGHLHSIYIHYAAERGIATMLALVAMLVQIIVQCGRAVRRLRPGPSEERFLLHGTIAVVLAIMISGISELNLGDSEVLAMFLAVAACGYIARERALECSNA